MKLKKNYLSIAMTLLLVLFISCGDDDDVTVPEVPAALLSTSFTASSVFLEVSTTNTSENALTHAWDFGVDGIDTDVSTEVSPSFVYEEEGTYTITLTTTGEDDQEGTFSADVTVAREVINPIASFTTSSMFLEVTTTNTSENALTHAWDFGVEGIDTDVSTEVSPSFVYEEAGTYTITLTATGDDDLVDTFSADVTVTEEMINPTAAFTSAITDLAVVFTDTSTNAVSYAWDFGDGTGTSTEASPSYTYAEAGTFTVSLTVTSETEDTDTTTADVTVEAATAAVAPTAAFTSEATDLAVTFTDTSVANEGAITDYLWDFGDGTGTSTEASPTYTYAAAGTYTVSLMVTADTGESNTTTSDVTVAAAAALVAPTADFTFVATDLEVAFTDASVANDGNITAYSWDFGDSTGTSTEQNPTYTYGAAGDFDVVLTITFDDIEGVTTATSTQSVTVTAPTGGTTQSAVVRDTDGGDTGELRLNLDNPLLSGMLVVTFTRALEIVDAVGGSDKDAFIALLNNSGSTSSGRSIMDLRIKDDEFTLRDQTFDVTSTVPTPGVLQTAIVTWTAPDADTPPTVTITIDGVNLADAGSFTSGAGALGGVERVQFRLADNGSILSNDATFTIDSMEVFSDVNGTTSIFATDFSEFAVGEVLDGTDDPFNSNSSEATVE